MMRLTRAVFLVGLCIVGVVASAHGECAWVLWASQAISVDGGPYRTEPPTLMTGYTSAADCIAWLDRTQIGTDHRLAPAVMDRFIEDKKGTKRVVTHVKWQCLPDTIDPRGPKGK